MANYSVPAYAGFDEGYAAYRRQDYATAMTELLPLAERGHSAAQGVVGEMFLCGQGVLTNFAEALKWIEKAADQDDAVAQSLLAEIYQDGLGVPKDAEKSVEWLLKSAQQGFAPAQRRLGELYRRGLGVEQNLASAAKWSRRAAEQDDAIAQQDLAGAYEEGWGVPRDRVQQFLWSYLLCSNPWISDNLLVISARAVACAAVERLHKEMPASDVKRAHTLAMDWIETHRALEKDHLDSRDFSVSPPAAVEGRKSRNWYVFHRSAGRLLLSSAIDEERLHTLGVEIYAGPYDSRSSETESAKSKTDRARKLVRAVLDNQRKKLSTGRFHSLSFEVTDEAESEAVCARYDAVSEDIGVPGLEHQTFIYRIKGRICAHKATEFGVVLSYSERRQEADKPMRNFESESEAFVNSLQFGSLTNGKNEERNSSD